MSLKDIGIRFGNNFDREDGTPLLHTRIKYR